MREKTIVGLGELLWDMLPEGKQLGGAPANFAVMSARMGNHAVVASRIGEDPLGREAVEQLGLRSAEGLLDESAIQVDSTHATGTVAVTMVAGQPEYVIEEPAAWDFLELTAGWQELAGRADAICFGTLAQRNAVSRQTIQGFLAASFQECVRVFDVNLRAPFLDARVIEQSLELATVFKLNDAEMPQVLSLLGLPESEEKIPSGEQLPAPAALLLQGARQLLAEFPLNLICITMGKRGSLLVKRQEFDYHPGVPVTVVDTVGAGDAFTAALTHGYLESASLGSMNEAGNRWGSWVASQRGAMPESW